MRDISKLYIVLDTESLSRIEQFLSSSKESIEVYLNRELSRSNYMEMESVFEEVRKYGIWITVNIQGYSNEHIKTAI